MIRTLALTLVLLAAGRAAMATTDVRLWHRLDAAMSAQLERHAADYNAAQQEFRVRLARLDAARPSGLLRLALPLETARPVLYYNRDAFRRAKLAGVAPPRTWYEMAPLLGALADAGQSCGYTTAWPAWVMLENSGGALSRQLMLRWTAMLASWEKAGFFSYSGRANEAEARFAGGECAMLTSSSASRGALASEAHFDMAVAPLPYYADAGVPAPALPLASAVWVERQSVGVANFFAFLAGRAAQARARRELMETELEAVWRGEKSPLEALEGYSRRAGGD
jgi:hypothetical protein